MQLETTEFAPDAATWPFGRKRKWVIHRIGFDTFYLCAKFDDFS